MKRKLMNRIDVEVALACMSSMAIYSRIYELSASGITSITCGTLMGFIVWYAAKSIRTLESRKPEISEKVRPQKKSIYSRQGYRYSLHNFHQPKTDIVRHTSTQKPIRILTGTPSLDAGGTSGITVQDILGL